ncbi:MAG: DUF1343 domain-containing protein, partial [Desulfobacterales bacterium]
ITNPEVYRPYETSLRLLQAVILYHKEAFQWKQPPYEYETRRLPIDLIIGDRVIRRQLEDMQPVESLVESWQTGLAEFCEISQRFWLYT